jgi:hypothetical protein
VPEVKLDQRTYEKLRFTASLMNCPVGDVIRLLVERLCQQPEPGEGQDEPSFSRQGAETGTDAKSGASDWLAVYRIYKKQRFDAEFNPSTMEVRITSAPWSGRVFDSPTAAAQSVLDHVPSDRRTNNTNGRRFWRLVSGGGDLRSIVGERF